MPKYLIFSYTLWDDAKPPGWDALVLTVEAQDVVEARKLAEEAALETITEDNWTGQKYNFSDDYQIVDADRLVLVERGKARITWAGDGNTYALYRLIPDVDGVE